jgi:hypothetical protein
MAGDSVSPRRRKALVFVDFDVLIRHFIMSGAFADLERRFDVVYVAHDDPDDAKKGLTARLEDYGCSNVRRCVVERRRTGLWYLLFVPTVLSRQRGRPGYDYRRKMFAQVIGERRTRMMELLSRRWTYPLYRALFLRRMGASSAVADLIRSEAPDVIIQPSLLTGPFVNELMLTAPRMRIPYILLMNSWDNPAVKAVATGNPDRLVVWGAHSMRQAVEYMGVPEDRIVAFGAAQFQVYRNRPVETRDELARFFGVPSGKPVVVYAGSGAGWYESAYLQRLDSMAQPGGCLDGSHILYRPHPWRGPLGDGERDFFDLGLRHVSMDPTMREHYVAQITGAARGMFLLDYQITNKLLALAAAVISPLSTILLESVLVGVPILIFAPPRDVALDVNRAQPHFRDLVEWPEIVTCFDDVGFEAACARLRGQFDDSELSSRLRERARSYVVTDGPTYSERLAQLAEQIVAARAA